MTYDHITNQFNRDLSPLARRMYAAMYEMTSEAGHSMYIAAWDINDTVKMAIHDPLFIDAIRELEHAGLIEYPQILMRYQLTPRALRAHLLHERSLKEQAFRALESTERALARCIDESDAAALLRDAVEGRR